MPRKNPKVGWGPVDDNLVKIITKALSSSQTPKKKVLQAQRIVNKLIDRGGSFTKEGAFITKSMAGGGRSSRTYAKRFPDEARIARKNVAAHTKPVRDAKAARKKSAAQLKRDEAIIARREANKPIIKRQEKTLRASRAGEAVGEKGTIRRNGREVPVSDKKRKDIERQGRLAASQRAKGNLTQATKQDMLFAKWKNAQGGDAKRKAKKAYDAHVDKYGRFKRGG